MDYLIRNMEENEYFLLEDFLYYAIFIPKGYKKELPKSVIYEPDLWRTISDFGKKKEDYCLVAEYNNEVIGAVWVRTVEQYGYVDKDTPSFCISVLPKYRGKGIGTQLMKSMLLYLKNKGYNKASLSVQKENYAVKMYKKLGFETIFENEEEYIMVYTF